MGDNKIRTVSIRITEKRRRKWQAEAEEAGLSITQWVTLRCEGIRLVRTGTKVA